jgi:hypothetical protein
MTEQEQVQVSQPCEMCGATAVREMVNHSFDYGRGDAKVTLRTLMPVWHCATCELDYTDAEGEAARHEATAEALDTMREARVFLTLVAGNVDWMPHPHCSNVDDALRSLEPRLAAAIAKIEGKQP